MIQRIVHGDITDPNGTRDITGLSPKHFGLLIATLINTVQGCEALNGATDEEIFELVGKFTPGATIENVTQYRAQVNEDLAYVVEMLEALNQPYEGGIYERPEGRVVIVDGKEVPLGPNGNS